MIEFANGGRLVQSVEELPALAGKRLYMDLETSSGSEKLTSLNPWHNCAIAGVCITVDDEPGAWYVPTISLNAHDNLPMASVQAWLKDVVAHADTWTNHNVKYDANVLKNHFDIDPPHTLACTLVRAKILDSDRMFRGGYGLDALSKSWLSEDISAYEARLQPYLHKNKDYGRIPADVIGEYGCQDAITVRRLDSYEQSNLPEECQRIWDVETRMTRLLYEIEQRGLTISPLNVLREQHATLKRLLAIETRLEQLTGRLFRPHVNTDCYDVLCNQFGLPVLVLTNEDDETAVHNPSFSKNALAQYLAHPFAPLEVVQLILEYRKLNTYSTLFLNTFKQLHIEGVLHSSYNQCVRTGRLSCKEPNSQQFDVRAKRLILPRVGRGLISMDYSQIEFRLICHYIRDEAAIAAYRENPDTDFHQWVANLCEMARKPAKNVNFMMGYGGGKKKCVTMLSANAEVVGALRELIEQKAIAGELPREQAQQMFEQACKARAERVYNGYHERLPGIKRTAKEAEQVCKQRGYVRNLFGRRRYLPADKAWLAFNNLNQSSAADIMKERMVALAESDLARELDVHALANVHDELLLDVPLDLETDIEAQRRLVEFMEQAPIPLRVPIRCTIGFSKVNWAEAAKAAVLLPPRANQ